MRPEAVRYLQDWVEHECPRAPACNAITPNGVENERHMLLDHLTVNPDCLNYLELHTLFVPLWMSDSQWRSFLRIHIVPGGIPA